MDAYLFGLAGLAVLLILAIIGTIANPFHKLEQQRQYLLKYCEVIKADEGPWQYFEAEDVALGRHMFAVNAKGQKHLPPPHLL